jgi:transposase
MPSLDLRRNDIVIGVDTHKDEHMAVALDGIGGNRGSYALPATPEGYAGMLSWAQGQGRVVAFGVEGTGSYGSGLARFLRRHDAIVYEVSRPPRRGERRASGKSDLVDAEHAARQVLSGEAASVPKTSDGNVEVLRLVKIARDTAVKSRTQAMIALKSALVTASDELRAELEGLSNFRLITACAVLSEEPPSEPVSAVRYVLRSLAQRWLALHEEVKAHARHLKQITEATAPQLTARFGIGFDCAAELLVAAGDNGERIRSEAAFAKLCGVCPIPASSGRTTGRHRLNRGGNRQANAALYRIVIVRLRWHQPTIDYVARRTAEGLTKKEIIRCLKRYVAREVFRLLPRSAKQDSQDLAHVA